jgi:hypothetical protein
MPFSLALPDSWARRGWKVKIRDRERLEPPHVTILCRMCAWRWDLRACRLMDDEPPPSEIPEEVMETVSASVELLRSEWDRMYPENPVGAPEAPDV